MNLGDSATWGSTSGLCGRLRGGLVNGVCVVFSCLVLDLRLLKKDSLSSLCSLGVSCCCCCCCWAGRRGTWLRTLPRPAAGFTLLFTAGCSWKFWPKVGARLALGWPNRSRSASCCGICSCGTCSWNACCLLGVAGLLGRLLFSWLTNCLFAVRAVGFGGGRFSDSMKVWLYQLPQAPSTLSCLSSFLY